MALLKRNDRDGQIENEGNDIERPNAVSRLEDTRQIRASYNAVNECYSHLSDLAEQQQECAAEHGRSRTDRDECELEEIKSRVTETLELQGA